MCLRAVRLPTGDFKFRAYYGESSSRLARTSLTDVNE